MAEKRTTRSPDLAAEICAKLSEGLSLRSICKLEEMPSASFIFKWLQEDDSFAEQYARAREAGADALVEELFEIADDGSNDWMERENKDGSTGWVLNGEHVQRSRLRVDTRKWYVSKILPKKYGEKLDLDHSGSVEHKFTEIVRRVVKP